MHGIGISDQQQRIVDKAEAKSLSFDDLEKMLGKQSAFTKLINYNDLKEATSIEQVFGRDKAVIILMSIEAKNAPKVGHWIALLDKPGLIEHFDSYGFSVDQELAITHEQNLLKKLLSTSGKKVAQSRRKFQQIREQVNTCGRWCVVRIKHFEMSVTQFSDFIDKLHYVPDVAVTMLTLHLPGSQQP